MISLTGPKKRYSVVAAENDSIISRQRFSSSGLMARNRTFSLFECDSHSYLVGYIEMIRCEPGWVILRTSLGSIMMRASSACRPSGRTCSGFTSISTISGKSTSR